MSLEIIIGSMFSGKSTELLRRLNICAEMDLRVLYLNHNFDSRGDKVFSTHNPIIGSIGKINACKVEKIDCVKSENFDVIGIDEGNGTRTGTAKNLVLWCDEQETEFHSNIKGSFDYLKEVLDNRKDYIGKQATIRFFQLTPDGIPRFPFAVGFRDYE